MRKNSAHAHSPPKSAATHSRGSASLGRGYAIIPDRRDPMGDLQFFLSHPLSPSPPPSRRAAAGHQGAPRVRADVLLGGAGPGRVPRAGRHAHRRRVHLRPAGKWLSHALRVTRSESRESRAPSHRDVMIGVPTYGFIFGHSMPPTLPKSPVIEDTQKM
jgi:hypothetical protein